MSETQSNIRYLRDPSRINIGSLVDAFAKHQDIIVSGIPMGKIMKLIFVAAAMPRSEADMIRIKATLDVQSPVRGSIVGVEASQISSKGEFSLVVLPKNETPLCDLISMSADQMRKMQHVGMSRIQSGDGNINIKLSGSQWAANDLE